MSQREAQLHETTRQILGYRNRRSSDESDLVLSQRYNKPANG